MHQVLQVRRIVEARPEIAFAYLHGSTLEASDPGDLDIAVYLGEDTFEALRAAGRLSLDFAIPLELELERTVGSRVDVQVLNRAPLSFRARVVSRSVVVHDGDPSARSEFEYLSRYEYFDFRPRREEYLAEVIGQ